MSSHGMGNSETHHTVQLNNRYFAISSQVKPENNLKQRQNHPLGDKYSKTK